MKRIRRRRKWKRMRWNRRMEEMEKVEGRRRKWSRRLEEMGKEEEEEENKKVEEK